MVIYKYQLQLTDRQTLKLPKNSEILSVASQNSRLCLWAMVDPKVADVDRDIEIFGTGNPIHQDMGVERKFLSTVVINPFVWHVFERLN